MEEEGVPRPAEESAHDLPDRDGARWSTFRDGKDRFGAEGWQLSA